MKRLQIWLCLLGMIPFALLAQRQDELFNTGWKFHRGDVPEAAATSYNNADWQSLVLPHDWSIESPFSEEWASATGYLPGGIGWYRKAFTLPEGFAGKKVFIAFDGVYNNSEVWINGHYLGKRPNGFVAFEYELTPYLNKTGSNTIAVKADHTKFADSRWYTGSGIYRDVHLYAVNPVHIPQWGVMFTATNITARQAKARVQVNVNGPATGAEVRAVLMDAYGNRKGTARQKLVFNNGDSTTKADLLFTVPTPALWSPESPSLYTLSVQLLVNGKPTDTWKEEVGIRDIRFTADSGFFLNGKNTKLKGVCIHDDAGVLGVAVPQEVWIRRLALLKAGGCNSIRMSHNPHAAYLYKLCDQMGFLVMEEAFDEWELGKNKWIKGWNKGTPGKDGYHEYFADWAEQDIASMVLRTRNSPSIIMWSIGNEIDYPNDPYSHEVLSTGRNPQIYGKGYLPDHPPAAQLGTLSARLVKAVKQLDTTRPVTAALAGVVMSNTTTYPDNLDLVGYNYQEYRYPEDHAAYPHRIIYGSENGMQLNNWNAVDSNRYISAQYLWTGIDYMGEAGLWPTRSNGAGLINLGGFPKPEYWFRKSLWSNEPVLYIGSANVSRSNESGNWTHKRAEPVWNKRTGDSISVRCFTNCDEVELFVNNRSLGRQQLASATNRILTWNLVYEPGTVTAKGYRQGKQVSSAALQTTGAPAGIKAEVYQHLMIPKQGSLQQITVSLVDADGHVLYAPGNAITVTVGGNATLKGIENSNLSDTSLYKANSKKVANGPLMVYVKPPEDGSNYTVTFTAEGIPAKTLEL